MGIRKKNAEPYFTRRLWEKMEAAGVKAGIGQL